jgi:hypothetical protein
MARAALIPMRTPDPALGGKDQGVSRPVGRVLCKRFSDEGERTTRRVWSATEISAILIAPGGSRRDVNRKCPAWTVAMSTWTQAAAAAAGVSRLKQSPDS